MSREGWETLTDDQKRRIVILSFERFVADPEPPLRALERFTGKRRHPKLAEALARERLPRPFSPEKIDEAACAVKEQLSPRYREMLDRCLAEYRDYWLKLSV
jgi:hypothetical protein